MRPKRLISLLVAVCMMITMLPLSAVTAFAADTAPSTKHKIKVGDYEYTYTANEAARTATITDFSGPTDGHFYDIDIPERFGDYTVTAIGDRAFKSSKHMESVTIPQSVTSIGDWAFAFCYQLKTISLDKNIETIGKYAFESSGLSEVTIPQSVTSIGYCAFAYCRDLRSFTINDAATSIGAYAFNDCESLTTLKLGEHITTIGYGAFNYCYALDNVTIPQSVTSIGYCAFYNCRNLSTITIPEKVEAIYSNTFNGCSKLESITLPAGLTSFNDNLTSCPTDCVIYFNNDEHTADERFGSHDVLKGRTLLCLCNVTFDANDGTLTDKGGNPTDHAVVSAYKTKKINADDLTAIPNPTRPGYNFTGWYTENDQPFDVDKTAITEDITLYARWEFDPNAPSCRPLTVTGGTVTVKYDGSDVTSKLNSRTDATTGKKTYSVPDGATVTVTLDKTAVPNGKVFDGWSTGEFSLPQDQNYKAESITFPMSSGVNVSAKYRDAATDHTPDTAVCHPLTVTGGIVTVKNGDKDVTDTLTVTTDEVTGKKTYSVPDNATVTVTLDKTLIPEGMVFDIWSTGKFSLPLGQDYKAESITFTMSNMSSDVDIAAQYRDASIEDDGPGVLGTAAIIGTAAVGGAVLGYQAYSLGAEFAGKLMALPYFPSNRSALAMMLWEDAGKPMPESELLYPDVEQEEQDMDLQHAARWAMENELIPDLNDEGTAPEEMKFFPANPVSKLDVLNAWQKAQELKNN
ncbi:MAG: leucine-rich repeat protein [Faecalibacterium sp.]|nr:leucine-rich repeat protein [Faecalibacterium sp.]